MPKPGELILLRTSTEKQAEVIENLRKIASEQMLQANELRCWILALLKKIGSQEVEVQVYQDAGEGENVDDVVLVEPLEDKPGVVRLSAGKIAKAVTDPEAKA